VMEKNYIIRNIIIFIVCNVSMVLKPTTCGTNKRNKKMHTKTLVRKREEKRPFWRFEATIKIHVE
jgi:hypothetical protein